MKTLASVAALALACIALWKIRRGRRVVLTGRFATAGVRAAALLLFAFQADRATAAEPSPTPAAPDDGLVRIGTPAKPKPTASAAIGGALPAALLGEGIRRWVKMKENPSLRNVVKFSASWRSERDPAKRAQQAQFALQQAEYVLPETTKALLKAELGGDTTPVPPATALAALDELEAAGAWEPALAAWLWRRVGDPPGTKADAELPAFYARLETHLRAVDTLTKTLAVTGPVRYSPWMSKSMRPIDHEELTVPKDLELTAKKLYPETPAGTWETDATIGFVVAAAKAPAVLHRQGAAQAVNAKGFVRLRRLDVLEAKSEIALEHATLGRITIPAGTFVTAWSLPDLLPATAKATLEKDAKAAVSGDTKALARLEVELPAAHVAIRAALAAEPEGASAPAMRQLLTTFDE